jgi:hypothetical protein
MGLDVTLCQFRNLDTEAILKFSRFSSEPWAFEVGAGVKLKAGARDLGLPESIICEPYFGGERISFPSEKHPKWPLVGDWSSFGTTRELIRQFTGKDLYFVFPEAEGDPAYFRPDWSASKERLTDILNVIQGLHPRQMESFVDVFVKPNIPSYLLERVKSTDCATPAELWAGDVAQIEVMIETLDYVLNHEHPRQFLLRWSV